MIIAQVGSCTAIELVGDSTNSSNENTFLEYEQNESIADLITEGTIFAVLCDDDGHDFYLLKATSESIILQENESDEWGASFSRGSSVIRGVYFAEEEFRSIEMQTFEMTASDCANGLCFVYMPRSC
jgi:hypothetical protein